MGHHRAALGQRGAESLAMSVLVTPVLGIGGNHPPQTLDLSPTVCTGLHVAVSGCVILHPQTGVPGMSSSSPTVL